ncbi:MAG: hypothetical protein WBD55_01930 [Dehalococcoidia bacterium]
MRDSRTDLEPQANDPLIGDLVDAMDAAADGREHYAVIVCFPQKMFGEDVADVLHAAEPALRGVLRSDDLTGRISDDLLVVGVRGTTPDNVRSLSYRLKGDLRLRTAHVRQTVWETGFASMPEDGGTAEELLATAVLAGRNARFSR